MSGHRNLSKSILGEEVYEALSKAIVKLNSKSVVDIEELESALRIAPKSVIAFLMKNLEGMEKDQAKEIELPWAENSSMLINKKDSDVFTGHIIQDGKIIHEFDFVSIPQLAAHILSLYELYDEVDDVKEVESAPKSDSDEIGKIKTQLLTLENKINALIMLSAGEPKVQKSQESVARQLRKGGLAPTMPRPPKPGVHSGSQKGITLGGLHGDKTAHSDLKPDSRQSNVKLDPQLKTGDKLAQKFGLTKQPKQPKQAKMSMTMKSESFDSKCLDCGEPDFVRGEFQRCACFKALSNPSMSKSEKNITFTFGPDWDDDSRIALWHSLRKTRK